MLRRLIGEDIELATSTSAPDLRPRARRPGPDRAGHPESGGQRPRRDARRRPADDRDPRTSTLDEPAPGATAGRRPGRTCCSRCATPARHGRRTPARASSSRSSRPRSAARAPAWGSRRSTASSSRTAATSGSTASRPRHDVQDLPAAHRRPATACPSASPPRGTAGPGRCCVVEDEPAGAGPCCVGRSSPKAIPSRGLERRRGARICAAAARARSTCCSPTS